MDNLEDNLLCTMASKLDPQRIILALWFAKDGGTIKGKEILHHLVVAAVSTILLLLLHHLRLSPRIK